MQVLITAHRPLSPQVGCAGGGFGFRASPDAAVECSERVGRAVAVALHADHLEVIRTLIATDCQSIAFFWLLGDTERH
jgi:hypothetical protein